METWLPTLFTETPEEGYDLAIKLSKKAIDTMQVKSEEKNEFQSTDTKVSTSLMPASQMVAINFQTVAAANNYWRTKS